MPWPPSLHVTQPSVDAQAGQSNLSTIKQGDDFNPGSNEIDHRMYPRIMPKRKSLNGLFGVSMKEAESFRSRHAPEEPVEEETVIQPSPPYISRFADVIPSIPRSKSTCMTMLTIGNTLRRVASATDKLVDLVTGFDFSPVSRKTIIPMDSLSSIAETIKEAHEGSPTPMRKVKSGVLSIRGVSPLRHGPNVSPLKLALHRKQLEAPSREVLRKRSSQNIFAPASPIPPMPVNVDVHATLRPPTQDQVVKVTVSIETAARSMPPPIAPHTALPPPPRPARRNIFAPPTPQVTAAALASLTTSDETVGKPKYRPVSCTSAFTDQVEHDVPQDLRDLFIDADHILSATASPAHVDGLPRPPPSDRRPASGRRRRNPPPAALPPSPPTPLQSNGRSQIPRDSMQSEFDFDGEFANLDQGSQRASFVEALHRATGDYHTHAHDLPPLPPLPERGDYSMDQFDDASERASGSSTDTVIVAAAARRERKSPFAGTFAFQQHVSHVKTSTSPPLEDIVPEIQIQEEEEQQEPTDYQIYKDAAEDDTMELTVPPPTRRGHRARRQDEAGVSIATMSSLGDVIETGIAGDYTNYFEAEFARDHAKKVQNTQSSGFDFSKSHSRQSSSISTAARHRQGHSRNTSIVSLASIDGLEMPTNVGPPRTMHNRQRSSYISKHRSGNSYDFATGRSDWAASHRRMQSDDSVMSNMSASRISRPGLGARMFELDGGVQLTSITGSPADGYDQDEQDINDTEEADNDSEAAHNMSKTTYYSTFENQDSFHTALDTSFDSEVDSAKESDWSDKRASAGSGSSRDSIFGPGHMKGKGSFLLRPISAITTDSSSNEEDTFINVSKSVTQMRRAPSCIEAQGEDTMSTSIFVTSQKSGTTLMYSSC
jgi:serine/arginine repetitive matrix protein 2